VRAVRAARLGRRLGAAAGKAGKGADHGPWGGVESPEVDINPSYSHGL